MSKKSGVNLQNLPRDGGVRECFVPRAGYLLCSVDYEALELRSLAQACLDLLGKSVLAEVLKRGEDPHLSFAAELMGISYEEAKARRAAGDKKVNEIRQFGKVANFGRPGGLGDDAFVDYAKANGVTITREESQVYGRRWLEKWPEMRAYFEYIRSLVGPFGEGKIEHVRSGRIRGSVSFTQAANSFFQGLAADGAKEALWLVSKDSYVNASSPLYGSRPVAFIHDEILTEIPKARAHEAAKRKTELMILGMSKWIPDVPIRAEPVLMRRWYKGAEPLYVDGKLVPVKPHTEENGNVKWVHDAA